MSEVKIERKVIRLAILGDSTVGKTSIINAYFNVEFSQVMMQSVGKDKYDTQLKMKDGKEMKLVIWDTAGQERFRSISLGTIKSSQGIVVAFDITNKPTFDNVIHWLKNIRDNSNDIPIVLFGNKSDLAEKRKVTTKEAEEFSKKNKIIYFETSAKENKNIEEGINEIAELAYKKSSGQYGMELKKDKKNKKNKKNIKFC